MATEQTLFGGNGRKDDLSYEGVRVVDPTEGIDETLDLTVEAGVITKIEPGSGGDGRIVAPGLRRPARPPAHAGQGGRGGHRVRHEGSGRGRLLRHPRDAEHRAGRGLGGRARRSGRAREGRSRDPGRLPRRDQQGAGRRRADGDGRARRARCGRIHRRRPPRRVARAPAPRAPVPRGHGPAHRSPLRGGGSLARRPGARGTRLGRARLRRLSVGGRERDGRPRPHARRLREPADPFPASVRARVSRRAAEALARPACRRAARSPRTTFA